MTIEIVEIQDIPLELEEWDVLTCLGARDGVAPALADEVAEAIALGQDLWSPRGICARSTVEEVGRTKVSIGEGPSMEGKFLAHLFSGAREATFLVVTIGIGLEARVSELFAEGNTVEAFVLDAVGSVAAMNAFTRVLTRVLEETKARGWDAGTCLRPDQSYWDITGQETIFQMVPAEKIGVRLLESSFMKPQKSQSGVVPLGPNLKVHGDPNESYCRYCQATRCPMRREPQVGQLT